MKPYSLHDIAWLCLIVLVGVYLRVDNIHNQAFMLSDESVYVRFAKLFSDYHIVSWTHGKPLYVLLLSATYMVFGFGVYAGAYLSVGLGLVNIVVMFLLGRLLFQSNSAGLLAAAIMATSRFSVLVSGHSTTSALAMLLVSWGMYLYYQSCRLKSRPRYYAAAFVYGLGFTTHYTLLVVTTIIAVLESYRYVTGRRQHWTHLLKRLCLFTVFFSLPSVIIELAFKYYWVQGYVKTSWWTELTGLSTSYVERVPISLGRFWQYWHIMPQFEGWLPWTVVLAATLWTLVRLLKTTPERFARVFLLMFAWVPFGAVSVIACFVSGGFAAPRGLVGAYPAFYLLMAAGLNDGYAQLKMKRSVSLSSRASWALPVVMGGFLLVWGLHNTKDLRAASTGILPAYEYLAANHCRVIGVHGDIRAWQVFFEDKTGEKVLSLRTEDEFLSFTQRPVEGKCVVFDQLTEELRDRLDRLALPYHEVPHPSERVEAILYERGTMTIDRDHLSPGVIRLYVLPR